MDDTVAPKLSIGLAKDLGDIEIRIAGLGDNCFKMMLGRSVSSSDICNDPAKEIYNPNTESKSFDMIMTNKKTGNASIKVQLCIPSTDLCISKQKVMHITPGPLEKIEIKTPANPVIVIEGGEIPLVINGYDKYGNNVGQGLNAYTISVISGNGLIYDGSAANTSMTFNDFNQKVFTYQAPIGLTGNKTIAIQIAPQGSFTA